MQHFNFSGARPIKSFACDGVIIELFERDETDGVLRIIDCDSETMVTRTDGPLPALAAQFTKYVRDVLACEVTL